MIQVRKVVIPEQRQPVPRLLFGEAIFETWIPSRSPAIGLPYGRRISSTTIPKDRFKLGLARRESGRLGLTLIRLDSPPAYRPLPEPAVV